jgi:hypothetical protein
MLKGVIYMIFEGNIVTGCIREVNMNLGAEIIAKGRSFGVDVWYDNHSFTPTGECDLFYASQDEEAVLDLMCWLQNTYNVEAA